jgi:alkanesulfonate monooxygenase SsuD/methylene tetrahydromethanopterin reductase-like flavin-dependent oxidoreductase (luciferase family)
MYHQRMEVMTTSLHQARRFTDSSRHLLRDSAPYQYLLHRFTLHTHTLQVPPTNYSHEPVYILAAFVVFGAAIAASTPRNPQTSPLHTFRISKTRFKGGCLN